MNALIKRLRHRSMLLLLRVAIGAIFISAGIASFQILPTSLINVLAMTLPILEMLLGALLIIGWRKRPALLAQ